jgi:serine/threonine-protein kinase
MNDPRTPDTLSDALPRTLAAAGLPSDQVALDATLAPRESEPLDGPFDGPLALGASDPRRYELRDRLGEGGMGTVDLCRDRVIGRDVALKRLHVQGSGAAPSAATARFLREARVQGQLEHPAIVPVHDLGVTPDGRPYFTMKRVRGDTLDELLARLAAGDPDTARRFGQRRLLAAFSTVCLAVDFAHSRGVLHRDLKPANVMLGEFGEVNVLDWGLA